MKTSLSAAIAVGILASAAASSGAVLTYGTFSGSDPDSSQQLSSFGVGGALAFGFTASRSDYSLTSVSLDLSTDTSALARVRIYSGASVATGSLLFTSTSIAPAGTSGVTTFTDAFAGGTMGIGLVSGQTYWIVVDRNGGSGSIRVHSATGNETATGASGITALSYYQTSTSDSMATPTTINNGNLPNFSVTVPEPHEYALVAGLGLCAFAVYRRRSARAIAA